jgi:hypothetical protein
VTSEQLAEIREVSSTIDNIYWSTVPGKMSEEESKLLVDKIVELYKLNKYAGRHKFKYLINRYRNRVGADKLLALLVGLSLVIDDTMIHKLVSRAIIIRQNLDTVSTLVTTRTNIPMNLLKPETILPEHVKCMGEMIRHLGMHDIYADFIHNKNLLFMADLNDELAAALEAHMLMKARRYKNFYNLVQYMDNFPKADKRKFFVEIFKHKTYFSAKMAIERLQKHPELQKYFIMK